MSLLPCHRHDILADYEWCSWPGKPRHALVGLQKKGAVKMAWRQGRGGKTDAHVMEQRGNWYV